MLPEPCSVRVHLQARTATLSPDEKIHRLHLARYGSGLVLSAQHAQTTMAGLPASALLGWVLTGR